MATKAARDALKLAELEPGDIDLIIFTGATRDFPHPWTASTSIMHELGATNASGFDLSARCPGVNEALWLAKNMIAAGASKNALVCAGDRFDKILPKHLAPREAWRSVFSAGAAAAVISSTASNEIVAFFVLWERGAENPRHSLPARGRHGSSRYPGSARAR